MIKFEKISLEQFKRDVKKFFPAYTDKYIELLYENIQLPTRGSKASAGYDIYSTIAFNLQPEDKPITIPLGIRAVMPQDMFLQVVPRSSTGFKTGAYLANTIGIIDADFYESKEEGHILLKIVPNFEEVSVQAGDRIVQGIFLKYYTTDDDCVKAIRTGGIGSTGV
jgi:dUTP pyrophosphatase